MNEEAVHLSVMPDQVLTLLAPQPGETFLDGTVGGGGHARRILEATAPDGRLLGLDRDATALRRAAMVLDPFGGRVTLRQRNFSEAGAVLAELGWSGVDGMLLDLGVSSFQLDEAERGFSFRSDAPLDMRMDQGSGTTAAEVLNTLAVEDLTRIFREYGEERWAGRIARRIAQTRQERPLATTLQLAELVRDTVPGGRVPGRIHPATRVFQALRIHVNGELDHLRQALAGAVDLLRPGGRLAVISFHSLEDRMVKQFFQEQIRTCVCPPRLPVCACDRQPRVELLTRRGLRASQEEIALNPRARSAILRGVCRLR
jgi:16S rRNA (cytosine1402-N4)-methyltransferase